MEACPVHAVANIVIILATVCRDFLQVNQSLDIRDHDSPVKIMVAEKRLEIVQTFRRGEDVNMMTNSDLGPEIILRLYLGNDFRVSFIFELNSENLYNVSVRTTTFGVASSLLTIKTT